MQVSVVLAIVWIKDFTFLRSHNSTTLNVLTHDLKQRDLA